MWGMWKVLDVDGMMSYIECKCSRGHIFYFSDQRLSSSIFYRVILPTHKHQVQGHSTKLRAFKWCPGLIHSLPTVGWFLKHPPHVGLSTQHMSWMLRDVGHTDKGKTRRNITVHLLYQRHVLWYSFTTGRLKAPADLQGLHCGGSRLIVDLSRQLALLPFHKFGMTC